MTRAAVFPLVAPSDEMAAAGTIRRGGRIAQEFLILVFDTLSDWHDRSTGRRHLAALDDRMLSDIGCDRGGAIAESMKPFWRR